MAELVSLDLEPKPAPPPDDPGKQDPNWSSTSFIGWWGLLLALVAVLPSVDDPMLLVAARRVAVPLFLVAPIFGQPIVQRRLKDLHASTTPARGVFVTVTFFVVLFWAFSVGRGLMNLPLETKVAVFGWGVDASGTSRTVIVSGSLPLPNDLPPLANNPQSAAPAPVDQATVIGQAVAEALDKALIRFEARQRRAEPPLTSGPPATATTTTPATSVGASGPPPPPAAAPSVGQFLVDLAPATGSCQTIGTSTYLGRDGNETNMLTAAGPAEDDFKGLLDRMVAGANAKETPSEDRARARLTDWMNARVNEIEATFGVQAALDFQRTPESDELVAKYRGVPLSAGSIDAIRRATGLLACWRRVLSNIQARHPAK